MDTVLCNLPPPHFNETLTLFTVLQPFECKIILVLTVLCWTEVPSPPTPWIPSTFLQVLISSNPKHATEIRAGVDTRRVAPVNDSHSKPVYTSANHSHPKPVYTSANHSHPKPVYTPVKDSHPKPVYTPVNDSHPKLVYTSANGSHPTPEYALTLVSERDCRKEHVQLNRSNASRDAVMRTANQLCYRTKQTPSATATTAKYHNSGPCYSRKNRQLAFINTVCIRFCLSSA